MRVLLDENLPRKLKYRLAHEHEVLTVQECGWSGVKNGQLLRLAAAEFDVMLTIDRGVVYQQNYPGLGLRLVVLHAVSNDYDDLLPLVDRINAVVSNIQPGEIVHIAP
jgi:hypothetical protein